VDYQAIGNSVVVAKSVREGRPRQEHRIEDSRKMDVVFGRCCRVTYRRLTCRRRRGESGDDNDVMPSLETVTDDLINKRIYDSGGGVSPRKRQKTTSTIAAESLPASTSRPPWFLVYDSDHGVVPVSKLNLKKNSS
jgi:hypothetical protein